MSVFDANSVTRRAYCFLTKGSGVGPFDYRRICTVSYRRTTKVFGRSPILEIPTRWWSPLTTMSTLIENIQERGAPARKSGRPRGVVSSQTQRMIATWDAMKRDSPTLNDVALLNAVADAVFGQRVNIHVRRRDRIRLKRTLQRHGRC